MEVWAAELGLPADEFLPILKDHFHVTSVDGIASLKLLSIHDYGEEEEHDFTLAQKQKLHEAVIQTPPELLRRLGGHNADPTKDELRL